MRYELSIVRIELPEKQPRGGMLAHVRDPDDNVLTLAGSAKEPASTPGVR